MKTLILATVSAAALMAAGSAFADSATDFAAAKATATAARSSSPYTSYVSQNGGNNSANVEQISTSYTPGFTIPIINVFVPTGPTVASTDSSVVIQGWPSTYSDSYAGAGDHSQNNVANVYQKGTGTSANRSVVMQLNYGSYAGNGSSTTQDGSGKNDAFTYQFGNSNQATISQKGSGSTSTAAVFNMKTVDDHGTGESVAGSLHGYDNAYAQRDNGAARIVQDEATNNGAQISMTNTSDDAGATIMQSHASGSQAYITQSAAHDRAVSYQNGYNNLSSTNQAGDNDKATTLQVGSDSGSGAGDATFNNQAYTTQVGANATAFTKQSGNTNYANTNQDINSKYAQSWIDQSGSLQHAEVTQSGGSNSTNGDLSVLTQTGSNDFARVIQTKNSDVSLIAQNGTGGASNQAYVTQNVAAAWSNVIQNGSNNGASVYQH